MRERERETYRSSDLQDAETATDSQRQRRRWQRAHGEGWRRMAKLCSQMQVGCEALLSDRKRRRSSALERRTEAKPFSKIENDDSQGGWRRRSSTGEEIRILTLKSKSETLNVKP
ncbi:hypothetical protein AAHE18_U044200 [Arachis hypogaea]